MKTPKIVKLVRFSSILLATFLYAGVSANAGELFLAGGSASGPTSGKTSDNENYIASAKNKAVNSLPADNMKQRSDWKTGGNTFCYAGACTVWVEVAASFEDPSQQAPWFASVKGRHQGVESIGDDVSFVEAKKNARQNAAFFCHSNIEEVGEWQLSKELVSADYYYWFASNKFKCIE